MKVKGTTYGWYNYTIKSQILLCARVGLWPAVFELQATMRQDTDRMTPKWHDGMMSFWGHSVHLTLYWKVKISYICITQLPPPLNHHHQSPKFNFMASFFFELQAIGDTCTESPQMTLDTKRSVAPHKYNYEIANVNPFRSRAAIFEFQVILR